MKEDKDLLKELLQTKFKDDVMTSSGNSFDHIFDAVQEKSDDKSSFFWYTAGVVVLMLIGVVALYYIKNNKTTKTSIEETTTEIPVKKENNNLVTKTEDTIYNKKESNSKIVKENKEAENTTQPNKDIPVKKVDVTTLKPEDEIIEKGVITVTYRASEKYASTEYTKYNRLPDSSTIVVRKNSNVNFTATKQGYRRADITGTVFLNIKNDVSKPFILFGKYCKIQITGKSFAIHSDAEADLMTLLDGSAKVVHNTTKEVRDLIPGESLRADKNGVSSLEKSPNCFAWKTRKLYYKDALVDEIITDLGDNYDAKIILKNRDILNCKYSGVFENTNIPQILKKLTTALNLKLTKEEDIFIITGNGCNK